ncbi:ester cyclase [candidate division WOR-3 bacterium]|nr:ester cyclase [candidate division WOR-3 bacterium]
MRARGELERIAREWISLWTAPVDWERFDALHVPTFEDCSSAGRPSDKAGFAKGLADFVRAFPDVRTVVTELVVDEPLSKVAVRWRAEGTNRARYLGLGPTHRRVTTTGIEIIEIRDGQVIRRWGEWDISGHLKPAL